MLPTDAGRVSEEFHPASWKAQLLKPEGASSTWKGLRRTHSQPCADGEMPNVLHPRIPLPLANAVWKVPANKRKGIRGTD